MGLEDGCADGRGGAVGVGLGLCLGSAIDTASEFVEGRRNEI